MTETGFTKEQRDAVMLRDGGICCLCGRQAEVVNHRLNRGAGGRLSLNRIDNGCALCHYCNGLIERDAVAGANARDLGIKLRDGDSYQTPMWSPFFQRWMVLFVTHCIITEHRDRTRRPDMLVTSVADDGVAYPYDEAPASASNRPGA